MKSFKEIMAKVASPAPAPPTASVSDDLDRGFVSWMEKKAGEDVVKTAAPSPGLVRKVENAFAELGTKGRDDVLSMIKRQGLVGGAKGALAGSALTAGAGALYLKGRRDQRAKTAGVIENPENLDLLSRVRALAAAQNKALLLGD